MTTTSTEVLNHQQIEDRIKRMAWQIYETHQDDAEIILAGIVNKGYRLAELIAEQLQNICPLKISLYRLKVDKKNPLNGITELSPARESFEDTSVIVVDDVLNTGSTLIYGVKHFLDHKVKQLKTVVLVDRNHKNFPVKADFKGLSLSTNLMEHVEVNLKEAPFTVVVS
ncbi:phosphoribosyltransferase family protein [Owenweeksia hongkongensis]|uniref:phosphoribosyltransferase family protein n=1 Tax=Owenweeksia hongkongensis TaxID=253245 RepID=UPI003A900605